MFTSFSERCHKCLIFDSIVVVALELVAISDVKVTLHMTRQTNGSSHNLAVPRIPQKSELEMNMPATLNLC